MTSPRLATSPSPCHSDFGTLTAPRADLRQKNFLKLRETLRLDALRAAGIMAAKSTPCSGNLVARRHCIVTVTVKILTSPAIHRLARGLRRRWLPALVAGVSLLRCYAAPLLEEPFNYPTDSGLAGNFPWQGANSPRAIASPGNLAFPGLREMAPAGNTLAVSGGAAVNVYRNFSPTPVPSVAGSAVYASFLIECTQSPTNTQLVASLLVGGATGFNGNDDPLAFYLVNASGGYRVRIAHHGEGATATALLATNTTHLIVLKYLFGGTDRCAVFIDPAPGQVEPAPDAITPSGEGDPFGNLQVIGFRSPALATEGAWRIDSLRAGTTWADVTPAPAVLTLSGPQNLAACAGNLVTFNVAAYGAPPLAYQWRASGAPIPGATASSFTITNATVADAARLYDVVVNDAFHSKTSAAATLKLSASPPAITNPPANVTGAPGGSASFSVGVADPLALVQWRKNGAAIPSATNLSLTLSNLTPADAADGFDAVLSNPCGSVTTAPPVFVQFPHVFFAGDGLPGFFGGMNLITTNAGGMNIFAWSCADPTLPLPLWTLEGQLSEQPLNDGTSDSRYSINVNPLVSPVYYVLGTTVAGPYAPTAPVHWITTDESGANSFYLTNLAVSAAGVLAFPTPPQIAASPVSQTVFLGKDVKFTVNAGGTEPLAYQWSFNNNSIAGATESKLLLSGVASNRAGNYSVIVTNAFGSATSAPAALVILPPPRLAAQRSGNSYTLTATAIPGDAYRLLAATNLQPPINWQVVAAGIVASNGMIQFVDNHVAGTARKFFRLAFSTAPPGPPEISTQPASRTMLPGKPVSFAAGSLGPEPLGWQWYFRGNLVAGNGSALALPAVTVANAGDYFAVVTNFFGSATTHVATLTVLPPLQLTGRLTASAYEFTALGVPGDAYIAQAATSVIPPVVWISIATNVAAVDGAVHFTDPLAAAGRPARFYRLLAP